MIQAQSREAPVHSGLTPLLCVCDEKTQPSTWRSRASCLWLEKKSRRKKLEPHRPKYMSPPPSDLKIPLMLKSLLPPNSTTPGTPNVGFCGTLRTPNVTFLIRGKDELDHQKTPIIGLTQNLQSLGGPLALLQGEHAWMKAVSSAQICQHWAFSHNLIFQKAQ